MVGGDVARGGRGVHRSVTARVSRIALRVAAVGAAAGLVVASPAGAAPTWSVVPSPNPAGSTANQLHGVACPKANSCFAVGESFEGSAPKALIEHWNGRAWHIVTSNPDTSVTSTLSSVACPSPTSCFVVGTHSTAAQPHSRTFIEHWNGRHWAVMAHPNPYRVTGDAVLNGISCPSTKSCFAVGSYESTFYGPRTLIEHWNGHHWAIMNHPDPNPLGEPSFTGVSCPSLRSCFAVGSHTVGDAPRPVIEHWNGRRWSMMTGAVVPGADGAALNGIACPFLFSCFAVGSQSVGSGTKVLVEHWNGRHWGYMPVVNPHSNGAGLHAVACPTERSCFVVGEYTAGATVKTLVEHWNGTTWTISATPDPGSTIAELASVACVRVVPPPGPGGGVAPPSTVCRAVGSRARATQTLTYAYG